eukprot:4895454-Pyramimonas_sp.AAC.1
MRDPSDDDDDDDGIAISGMRQEEEEPREAPPAGTDETRPPEDEEIDLGPIRPPPDAAQAACNLLRLLRRIPTGSDVDTMQNYVERHNWSAFNVTIFWAAAGDANEIPIISWLEQLIAIF